MTSTPMVRYRKVAGAAAEQVLRGYSTSFGLACRLLPGGQRRDIAAIYALVRVADEIVDGTAADAGLGTEGGRRLLDAYREQVYAGIRCGYSTDLVIQAFAATARRRGIGPELIDPFFASMARDLSPVELTDRAELDRYVHGSAEVVGLMCLRAFVDLYRLPARRRAELEHGATRLGSAFQLVNFVRDLGDDSGRLGRRYLPELDPRDPTEEGKHRVLDRIDDDLAAAIATLPLLPVRPRIAVATALGLFRELSVRLREVPAKDLLRERVRVPDAQKVRIAAAAALGRIR